MKQKKRMSNYNLFPNSDPKGTLALKNLNFSKKKKTHLPINKIRTNALGSYIQDFKWVTK